jgi:hypothetical protein
VPAYQVTRRLVDGAEVEPFPVKESRRNKEWIEDRTFTYRINVGARASAEPGAEILARTSAGADRDGGSAHHVDSVPRFVQVEPVRGLRSAHYLGQCMHARVRAARRNCHRLGIEKFQKRSVEIALDRTHVALSGKAVKRGAVVRKVEAEVQLP